MTSWLNEPAFVHFLAIHPHEVGGGDTETDPVTFDSHHGDADVAPREALRLDRAGILDQI